MYYEAQVQEANKIYEIFNKEFYQNKLPKREVYIGRERREEMINIKPDDFAPRAILHEMAHLYCKLNNIKDTTRQGRYHNTAFREVALSHGLYCEFCKSTGWSVTSLSDRARHILVDNDIRDELFRTPIPTESIKRKQSFVRLYCPECKASIRGTINTKVRCANPSCISVLKGFPALFIYSDEDGRGYGKTTNVKKNKYPLENREPLK